MINNINLVLTSGHILGICGPSGAGKLTLLRLLGGIEPPSSGEVLLDGTPLWVKTLTGLRRQVPRPGYVMPFHQDPISSLRRRVHTIPMTWFESNPNRTHVERLRSCMTSDVDRVVMFLGAGLSFGSSRRGRKSLAERDEWGRLNAGTRDDDTTVDSAEIIVNDDNEPFPTWSRLKSRMRAELVNLADQDQASLNRFFRASDPLDCAQLFRNLVGPPNYFEFLRSQFQPTFSADYWITPSHNELVALELPLLFTTNYDNLIERAYAHCGRILTVSSTAEEFIAHLHPKPDWDFFTFLCSRN